MKAIVIVVVLAAPAAALAQDTTAVREERGHNARLIERYCDKLREGPEAYVQFVRRLQPVHGFTYSDFAPEHPGAAVRADCRVSAQRVAEVNALAQKKR